MIEGIDAASYQGEIDASAVKAAGKAYLWEKATQGVGYVNPFFQKNWTAARSAGLTRGAYHYLDGSNPIDQAEHFLSVVGPLQQFDLLALDVEEKFPDPWKSVAAFLGWLTLRVGYPAILYTGKWYVDLYPIPAALAPTLARFGLWQAAYQDTLPAPITPWPFVAFHQYSDKGTCPGINGPVDLDRFNGPVDRLRLYGKP